MTLTTHIEFQLPDWVSAGNTEEIRLPDIAERVLFTIGLARQNVISKTGGPFGAAVFERDTGLLLAIGVNIVVPTGLSILHAEVVALSLAQRLLGTHDLGRSDIPALELVTSVEPCVMCFGAVHWSGVKRLVCAAREVDARSIGFDEGQKPADWTQALQSKGIDVVQDIRRDEAAEVLRLYGAMNGQVY